jgi:glutamyl-tRNA(Gln) amidotransferase subunit E
VKHGTNGFERILPGPDRMYPDTDMPPVALEDDRIERTRQRLPLAPWERREAFRRLGLSSDLVEGLSKDGRGELVLKMAETLPMNWTVPAVIISQTLKHLERKGFPVSRLDDGALTELFRRFSGGEFAREAFPDILKLAAVEGLFPAEAVARLGLFRLSDGAVREIAGIVAGFGKSLEPWDPVKKFRNLMGILMAELRGKADGVKVAAALEEALGKGK